VAHGAAGDVVEGTADEVPIERQQASRDRIDHDLYVAELGFERGVVRDLANKCESLAPGSNSPHAHFSCSTNSFWSSSRSTMARFGIVPRRPLESSNHT
jgi:hypothetical protein